MDFAVTHENRKTGDAYQVFELTFQDYMDTGFADSEFITTHMSNTTCEVTLFLTEDNFEKLAEALGDMAHQIRVNRSSRTPSLATTA
jgi:hypothetical protein